jgi:hypothetical protein
MDIPSLASIPSSVSYSRNSLSEAGVRWSHMPYTYDSNYTDVRNNVGQTFQITLMPSGKIRYSYINISDPAVINGLTGGRHWLVGIRAGVGLKSIPKPYGGIALENEWLGSSVSTQDGVYVPRAEVVSNTSLSFLPFPSNMCATPRYGPATGGNKVVLVGAGITSWFTDIDITCLFGDKLSSIAILDDMNTLSCTAPEGEENTTVPLQLAEASTGRIISNGNKLFYSYWPSDDAHVTNISLLYTKNHFCTDCHSLMTPSDYCQQDCNNVWDGTATLDDCNVCSGGNTGHIANSDIDCADKCFGGNLPQVNGQCSCTLGVASLPCNVNPNVYAPAVINGTRSHQYIYKTVNDNTSWSSSFTHWNIVDASSANGTIPLLQVTFFLPFLSGAC